MSRLISLILQEFSGVTISFSVIYFILNMITTLAVWRRIGHKFILYSLLWFSLTSVIDLPPVTSDALLISVFGGIVNGFAVGMALRSNASGGGTDFIAIDLSRRLHRPSWNYIFALNACVLLSAGYIYSAGIRRCIPSSSGMFPRQSSASCTRYTKYPVTMW